MNRDQHPGEADRGRVKAARGADQHSIAGQPEHMGHCAGVVWRLKVLGLVHWPGTDEIQQLRGLHGGVY